MRLQGLALAGAPLLGRDLGCLARTRLGAEENCLERHPHAHERRARGLCLMLATRGQPAFGVGARPVRLSLSVT